MHRRHGFTLIELLIVIVIIGVLAAIAIPKFTSVRERAYYRAMQSDLRNLNMQQELYHTANYTYTTAVADLQDFRASEGVTVTISEATNQGWAAEAAHGALAATQLCGILMGTAASAPAYVTVPGQVICTGE